MRGESDKNKLLYYNAESVPSTVYRVLRGVRDYFVESDYIKKIAAKLRG